MPTPHPTRRPPDADPDRAPHASAGPAGGAPDRCAGDAAESDGEPPDAPPEATRSLLRDRNLLQLLAVTLVAVSSISAVSPALPGVSEALGLDAAAVGLVITAYTLPGVVLPPLLGVLADRHGRKRVLLGSLALFGVAGAACALAGSLWLLLALRFVQGVGGAVLFSLNTTLIGDLHRGRDRANLLGVNGTVVGIGSAVYPAIGGGLALLGWHWPFLLAALAVPVGVLLAMRLDVAEPRDRRRLRSYLAEVASSVERRGVLGLLGATALTYFALTGAFFTFVPQLLERSLGASALLVGVLLSARAAAFSLSSALLGRLARRVDPRRLIEIGSALAAVSLASIPFAGSVAWVFVPAALYGVAAGLFAPSSQLLLMNATPTEQRATMLSLNAAVKRLGQTLGPVLLGVVAGMTGVDGVFLAAAGALALALVLELFLLGRRRPVAASA